MQRQTNSAALATGIAIAVIMIAILTCVSTPRRAQAQEAPAVRLHAAGSLRAAMTEIAQAFTAAYGIRVDATFGPSGLLRERFEKGEAGDVFASADMGIRGN